jgi:hypothetical protein
MKMVGRSGRAGRRIGKSEIKVINEFLNSCWAKKKKRRMVPKIKRNGHFNSPVWSNNSSSLAVCEKFNYYHADELS